MTKLLQILGIFFCIFSAFAEKHSFNANIINIVENKEIIFTTGKGDNHYAKHGAWSPGKIYEGQIQVDSMVFDARFSGPSDGEVVILLHGFAQSSFAWRSQLKKLGLAGYFVIAPNQRGYSPGARPVNVADYDASFLFQDVIDIADQIGAEKFHLVGHDFGALVAWGVAASNPDRISSLTSVTIPHLDAFDAELADMNSCQYKSSVYFDFFISPMAKSFFLANDAAELRALFTGLNAHTIDEYVELLGTEEALGAALNWYRANITNRRFNFTPIGSITVPTLLIVGSEDDAICREAADATGNYITASYHYKVFEGVGHLIPELASRSLNKSLLRHLHANMKATTVSFKDVTEQVGINFVHGPAPDLLADRVAFLEESVTKPIPASQDQTTTWAPYGRAGVAIFDYDNDGDLDIFATNSETSANALYQNQLSQHGSLAFVDVATTAGVAAPEHASTGVCYGDTDNDGDKDLFVVSSKGHRIYVNNGDGTFSDISSLSGNAFSSYLPGATSCAFGDINNDGKLDVTVSHGINENEFIACVTPFGLNIKNELFLNTGANVFVDISESSGIRQLGGVPEGAQGLTWSATFFDYDQDGDVDLINTDDNCGVPFTEFGGVDRGFLQLWSNDGLGNFTNVTESAGLLRPGSWMGTAIADLNHDGHLDFFATNQGDYAFPTFGLPWPVGSHTSRWFLSNGNGTFSDPGVGDIIATPFGWGTVAEDLDNDGDTDIAYIGGLETPTTIVSDNPGTILLNDGNANFYVTNNYSMGLRELRRNSHGFASGDLNGDGFVDLVSASPLTIPENIDFMPPAIAFGSFFDPTAVTFHMMDRLPGGLVAWNGNMPLDGNLAVDINHGNNKFRSIAVNVVGTIGITDAGKVNRDGYGAIVSFTPKDGETAMKPVTGGNSHQSQSSHTLHFGLGNSKKATIDILWPGGIQNRMAWAHKGDTVTFPEIPCAPDGGLSRKDFRKCVKNSLHTLIVSDVVDQKTAKRLKNGMWGLYEELH